MSNNIFSWQRLMLLFRQYFIHSAQFLLLSIMAYVGVIFIVLSIAQVGNDLKPLDLEIFQGFMIGFVTVFGVLYVGHSFPAFRTKESTINYLMLPASELEKFIFEFVSRIGIILPTLPLLYWMTFHVQGYFFAIFTEDAFLPIGVQYLVWAEVPEDYTTIIYMLITAGVLFVLSVVFAGSAMFAKQPLVKTLFTVAVAVALVVGYSYIMIEHVGLGRYEPPDDMVLVPMKEDSVLRFFTVVLMASTVIMLFVAFRKLKEREV